MSPSDPVWDELGKIDYLLNQVARAVERGELDAGAWDRLSPRYLERRSELAAVLSSRAGRAAAASGAPEPVGAPVSQPVAASVSPPVGAPVPLPLAARPASVAPSPEPSATQLTWETPTPNARLSAGAWMSYAGSLLVVIAVAIFTIYAWATFPPALKLTVLLGVTVAFYAGGEFVRVKLDLPAAGVALVSVGSAMLLFDGWSVIMATGATGALPWAIVLLLCSLAYWVTELRISGGWFGAIGAAAQVGWWWMLGQAFGLETYWVAAGMSVVAAAWALAAGRDARPGPLGTLAAVLRFGAPVLAVLSGLGAMLRGAFEQTTPTFWPVAAAFVAALSFMVVVETLWPKARGLSAAGHVPLISAVLGYWAATSALGGSPPALAVPVTLAALTVAYCVYAPWRGFAPYGVASLVVGSLFWQSIGERYAWEPEAIVAALLAFGLVACIGGVFAGRSKRGAAWAGAESAAKAWELGGIALIALATVLTPVVGGVPLSGTRLGGAAAALGVGVLVAWAVGGIVRRSASMGRVALVWSFYALAATLAWAWPGWHSAWYGCALLALAAFLSQGRALLERSLRVPEGEVGGGARVAYIAVTAAALAASAYFFHVDSIPVAGLLAVAALAWLADGLRTRDWWTLAASSGSAVAAATIYGWAVRDLSYGVLAAAALAAVIAAAGLLAPRGRESWGAMWAMGGTLVATLILPAGLGAEWRTAVALLCVAVAWALTGVVASLPELWAAAGVFASFALLAVFSWRDVSPVVTVVGVVLYAFALLIPRAFTRGSADSRGVRLARSLAVAGMIALLELCVIGVISRVFGWTTWLSGWLEIGATGLAIGLLLAGGYVIALTSLESSEVGLYPGAGLVVLGAMVQMDAWSVPDIEWFLVLAALYFAAMGVLWASREPGRKVPVGTDIAAFALAVVAPFIVALTAWTPDAALRHGLWALGLAAAATMAGLATRTRIYFQGGILVLVLNALWLSRGVLLALPSWVWIGTVGLSLIVGGVAYARREQFDGASRRLRQGFADWR
jgi:hypothetical protein